MTDRPISRNVLGLFLGRILAAGGSLAATYLLTRSLAPEEFGLYGLLVSLLGIAATFVDFGGNAVATREMARDPERAPQWLGVLLVTRGIAAAVAALAGAAYFALFAPPEHRVVLVVSSVAVLVLALGGFDAWFHATGRIGRVVLPRTVSVAFFVAALSSLAAGRRLGLDQAVFLRVAFPALGSVWVAMLALRGVVPDLRGAIASAPAFARRGGVLGLATVCTILYFYLDTVLLDRIRGPREVAVYQAGYRVFGFAATMLATVLVPFFPYLSRVTGEAAGRLVGRLLVFMSLVALPPAVAAILLAPDIARDFFGGGAYAASVPSLRLLMATLAVIGGGMIGSTVLIAAGRERTWLRIAMAGLAANALLNLLVLPRFGATGAAATTLATEAAVTAIALRHATRVARPRIERTEAGVVLLATAALAAAAALLAGRPLVVSGLVLAPAFLLLAVLGLRSLRRLEEEQASSLGKPGEPPE